MQRIEDLWSQERSWEVSASAKVEIRTRVGTSRVEFAWKGQEQASELGAGVMDAPSFRWGYLLDRGGGVGKFSWKVACFSKVNIRRA